MKLRVIIVILLLFLMAIFMSGCTVAPSKLHGRWRNSSGYTLEFYREWTTERCIMYDSTGNGIDVEVKIINERITFRTGGDSSMSVSYDATKTRLCLEETDCYERTTEPSLTDSWIMKLEEWWEGFND